MTGSLMRIWAVFLRHWYILRGSWARVVEIIYWPSIQVVLWGFISQFFAGRDATTINVALGTLLGAVLLWDMLFRSQLGVAISYIEETRARNLGHLFISPLRLWEWSAALVLFSVCRTLIGFIPAMLLAIPLYGFSILDFGPPLLFFFLNLMLMGWWLGLAITGLLIRIGPGMESIAWGFTFFLMPFCAVFYPVSVYPEWLRPVSLLLPAAHVFEGVRALVYDGVFEAGHMWAALGLNAAYATLAVTILYITFNGARKRGTLLQTGE